MAERVSPLDRLGAHVSGSLEQAQASPAAVDAAARVRARLASGEGRARATEANGLRVRRGAIAGAAFALVAAAAVLAFALGAWRGDRSALTFVVASESGVVGAFLAAPPGAELPVSFSDGTRVSVAAGSRARIAEVTPRGARILVESGVVHANVVHAADTRWLVDAGPFEVKVTGTRFDVAWQPSEQAIVVTLHEGSVVVTGCGLADGQRVSAGQQLHASCKSVGTSSLTSLADGSSADGIVATAASSLPDAPAAPPVAPAATTIDPPRAAATSASSAPAVPAAPAPSLPSAADLLARANADRYAGRFDSAAESLETVRRRFGGSDTAATAAFELGRIAFDGRHDFTAAGNWFDTYLRERPAGAFAREALGRAIEARHRAGDTTRAEQLATRYLAAYPDGPHATLARRLCSPGGAP
jgi:ferric-dicitrate binding protein FerR (iron transport regulator)